MNFLTRFKPLLSSRTVALTVAATVVGVSAAVAAPGEPVLVTPANEAAEVSEEDVPRADLPEAASDEASDALERAGDAASGAGEGEIAEVAEEIEIEVDDLEAEDDGNGEEQRSEVANWVHENRDLYPEEGPDFGQAVADVASDGRSGAGRERAEEAQERAEENAADVDDEERSGPPEGVPPVDVPKGPPTDAPTTD